MIAKIRNIVKNKTLSPHGGVVFVMDELRSLGIPKLFDKHLGTRVKQAKYRYSDIALSWIHSIFCGSERLEDTKQLKPYFKEIPDTRHPSPDRIAGIFKSLATPIEKYNTTKTTHEFNIHLPLNRLLIDTSLKLNLLNTTTDYIMDYDNTIIPCEKYDSVATYKQCDGYQPGVAFLNSNIPVYIENRNGNSLASYKMADTIERSLQLLEEKNIKVKTFRSDSAAYSSNVIHMLDNRNIEFFIRARNSELMFSEVIDNGKWERVDFGIRRYEISSTEYLFKGKRFRVVVTRGMDMKRKKKNKYTNDDLTYRSIITNNWELSDIDVVKKYNKRGKMELAFRDLSNDWNWKRLPFSYLNQNTVFMIFGAIGYNIYHHMIRKFSKKLPFVKSNFRLKNFIFHFIAVTLEWIDESGEKIPVLYSPERDYSPLFSRPPSND